MELRQTLIDISDDARGWLEVWAGDFTEAESTESGGTKTNPVAWQLGHIATAEDDAARLFGGAGIVTAELHAICGSGCPAPTPDTRYPPLEELWDLLEQTHAQLLELLEGVSDTDLDRAPLKENPYFRSLGQAIYELALHENYHVGEIGTLRKGLGKERIG